MSELNGPDELEDRVRRLLVDYGIEVASPNLADAGVGTRAWAPGRNGPVELRVFFHVNPRPLPPGVVMRLLDEDPRPLLIAQSHVTRQEGARLRGLGAFYIDSGGNCWIGLPGFRVQVEGLERTLATAKDRRGRIDRPAGMRVVFALLVEPRLVEAPIRSLASAARVSVGTAHSVLIDLEDQGFVAGRSESRPRLRRTSQLADTWVGRYPFELLPSLEESRARGPEPDWWLGLPAARGGISGETAMSALGFGIRAATVTIYGDPPWAALRKEARLKSVVGATNVILRERFYGEELDRGGPFVPTLLIYADALASGDSRQAETAREMLREDADLRRVLGV